MEEEGRPRRKIVHDIGQVLDDLSAHELEERITLLQGEIDRLRAEMARKASALNAADAIFGARPR